MPTVLYINGFRFYFFSNENNEPMHIHIEKAEGSGKIWLEPFEIEYLYGFTKKQEKQIKEIAQNNLETFKNKWNEHFGK